MKPTILFLLLTTTAFGQTFIPKGCKVNILKSGSGNAIELYHSTLILFQLEMKHTPNIEDAALFGKLYVTDSINEYGFDSRMLLNRKEGDILELICSAKSGLSPTLKLDANISRMVIEIWVTKKDDD